MTTIGSEAALITVLFATSFVGGPALQPDKSPVVDIKPYPGSKEFCSEHIILAPEGAGKAGGHINWTGYIRWIRRRRWSFHYTKILGSKNHQKESNGDVWRFPLETPERVPRVTHPDGYVSAGTVHTPAAIRAGDCPSHRS